MTVAGMIATTTEHRRGGKAGRQLPALFFNRNWRLGFLPSASS
jgi:hypothetical protein